MPTLPLLKTGAVLQYPASREMHFRNHGLRFVDGGEQHYRDFAASLKSWVVRLDLLDEAELNALDEFFESRQGRFGSFSFTDPWDQIEYTDCSLDDDEFEASLDGELRGRTILVIRQNRS